MKILILMLLVAVVASEETHKVKRSPDDDDLYIFYPFRGNAARVASGGRTTITRGLSAGRTSFAPTIVNPFQRRYIVDFDDLYDDRRKRQIKPSDGAVSRQKRSPDDDDLYIFYPFRGNAARVASGGRTTITRGLSAGRTSFAPTIVNPFQRRYVVDFDDLYDDRRKRQIKPADGAVSRQKRSPDDDDLYIFYQFRGNAAYVASGGRPTITRGLSAGRTSFAPTIVNPFPRRYVVDFDDLYDDRRKRQTKPSDASVSQQ